MSSNFSSAVLTMYCTADMTDLIRRLSLVLLLFLLLAGAAGHLFLSAENTSHAAQEANCSIHSGMAQPEKAQPFTLKPTVTIGETQDGTCAFNLSAKISHPPTF
ncbi:MAG: hypothetical protein Q7T89_15350 [Anaerolineales bacterium]|nr:hypothetical protein [Anaerolineales bacterium]